MAESRRLIVTGTNKAGKSVVVEETRTAMTGPGNFDFWQTKPDQSPHDLGFGRSPMKFFPAPGGSMFRLFTIPPADPNMTPMDIAKLQEWFFKEVGDPEARGDTSRHPMMHKTPTVDYVVLLSGEISLVLDEGEPVELKPFDAVVQRGVGHSWLNTGREPALLVAVMVGGK
jgi:mannose-6-phosphate isomerase-like protein (cupin superfamily)